MMRNSLFEREQSVLLVGEGNFSFSVELIKLDLNLKLTSSCFERNPSYLSSEENIHFLKQKGVRVLLNIDATRLSEYEELRGCTFHRIVFNFPHVGGKSKIQLNRELLSKFFISCAPLLSSEGAIIVSLCHGQGGSNQETVQREYSDTWKAAEMAAHGGFVLVAVEPWKSNSPLGVYSCIGRRSLDSSFRREGAMVHVFCFAPIEFQFKAIDKFIDALLPQHVELSDGKVLICSHLQNTLLKKDLLSDSSSTLKNLLQNLIMHGFGKKLKIKSSKLPPVSDKGYLLRTSELKSLLKHLQENQETSNEDLQLFWGTAFRDVGCDFSLSPALCFVAVLGFKSVSFCEEWLTELGCSSMIISDVMSNVNSNICLISLDTLALNLFQLRGWQELWATGAKVLENDGALVWQPASISSPVFTFDISIASQDAPDIDKICHVLWQLVGEMVRNVEVVDNYKSPEGWFSKCIRITYCSYEIALYRSKVVKLHEEVIGPVLERYLGVNVR